MMCAHRLRLNSPCCVIMPPARVMTAQQAHFNSICLLVTFVHAVRFC